MKNSEELQNKIATKEIQQELNKPIGTPPSPPIITKSSTGIVPTPTPINFTYYKSIPTTKFYD